MALATIDSLIMVADRRERKLHRKYVRIRRCPKCGDDCTEHRCFRCGTSTRHLTLEEIRANQEEMRKLKTRKVPAGAMHYRVVECYTDFYSCAQPMYPRGEHWRSHHPHKMTANPQKVTCKVCQKHVASDRRRIQEALLKGEPFYFELSQRTLIAEIPIYALNVFDFNYNPNRTENYGGYHCILIDFFNQLEGRPIGYGVDD